jgi:hypothetical protein
MLIPAVSLIISSCFQRSALAIFCYQSVFQRFPVYWASCSASPNSATWDGMNYVKGEERAPDPYALAWWSILCTIAGLLEAQESPLSAKQIEYLKGVLFGGMGSLNDLCLKDAASINQRLEESRHRLWLSFQDMIGKL